MVKHAYLEIIHSNFAVLNKMIELLDRENNDFYILVDKKVNISDKEILSYHPTYPQIIMLPRIEVNWGASSGTEATLMLLQAAFDSPQKYDYFHLVQGADFPIKSADEIDTFFEKNCGYEFLSYYPWWYEFGRYKINQHHFWVDNRYYRTHRLLRYLSHGVAKLEKWVGFRRGKETIYSGSALWTLSADAVGYLLERRAYISKRCRYSLAGDEVIWHTMMMASPFREKIYRFEEDGANLYRIDWARSVRNSPHTFDMDDLEQLLALPDRYLYARKFDEKAKMDVVDALFERLIKR